MKLIVVGMLACTAISAFAAESGQQGAAESKSDPHSGNQKVVCKREKVIGSNLSERPICLTREQWQQLGDRSKRELRDTGNKTLKIEHKNGG